MCIRDSFYSLRGYILAVSIEQFGKALVASGLLTAEDVKACLLYTSDAADDLLCLDLGGRRIIKKKQK